MPALKPFAWLKIKGQPHRWKKKNKEKALTELKQNFIEARQTEAEVFNFGDPSIVKWEDVQKAFGHFLSLVEIYRLNEKWAHEYR